MTGAKIGRNAPCPCGSGKKLKKCCGQTVSTAESGIYPKALDWAMIRMYSLLRKSGLDVWRWRRQVTERIEKKVFSRVPQSCLLSPDDAVPLLQALLLRLEEELSRILSSDSRYFWLFLSRRLSVDPRKFQSSRLTTALYWTIMNLAIFKYGLGSGRHFVAAVDAEAAKKWALSECEDEMLVGVSPFEGGTLLPTHLTLGDVKDIFLLEQLAYDFWACTATLRRVWKGAASQ